MAINDLFIRLDTVILRVRDLTTAREWYEHTLDLRPAYIDESHSMLVVFNLCGTTSLTILQLKPGEALLQSDARGAYPTFLSASAVKTREALAERGVEVSPLVDEGGVLAFTFHDPDGNLLEVVQLDEEVS